MRNKVGQAHCCRHPPFCVTGSKDRTRRRRPSRHSRVQKRAVKSYPAVGPLASVEGLTDHLRLFHLLGRCLAEWSWPLTCCGCWSLTNILHRFVEPYRHSTSAGDASLQVAAAFLINPQGILDFETKPSGLLDLPIHRGPVEWRHGWPARSRCLVLTDVLQIFE